MLSKPVESYGADTVCLDLEDGVAANQKVCQTNIPRANRLGALSHHFPLSLYYRPVG
jgi:citrate lyase beta subunit